MGGEGFKIGQLSSLVVTSYRLPIVTISLTLTVLAVLRLVMEGRMDEHEQIELDQSNGLAKGSTMH